MIFKQALRRELSQGFAGALMALLAISMTILLLRTLSQAASGKVNPQEVFLFLGFALLGQLPIILTMALMVSVVMTLSRMHQSSEMVVWHGAGLSHWHLLKVCVRFAWPVWLVVGGLSLVVWPWAQQQGDLLRERFQQRGDLERVVPGQFQESADGQRVFFINQLPDEGGRVGNVFIRTQESDGRQTVTTARHGDTVLQDGQRWLRLEDGQRMEQAPNGDLSLLVDFEQFSVLIEDRPSTATGMGHVRTLPTTTLIREPVRQYRAELAWRVGMLLTSVNLVLLAVAMAAGNPRLGRGGNLAFFLLAYVVYFNLLSSGQGWMNQGVMAVGTYVLLLHGGVAALAGMGLMRRIHGHWNMARWWHG